MSKLPDILKCNKCGMLYEDYHSKDTECPSCGNTQYRIIQGGNTR